MGDYKYLEVNKKISKAKEDMDRYEKISRMLETLSAEIKDLEGRGAELGKVKEKEEKEYEAIKAGGIRSVFYRMLGTGEKHLEKERQEAFAANLKYQQCNIDIEELQKQKEKLKVEMKQLSDASDRYNQYYEEKRGCVLKDYPNIADQVMELTKQKADSESNLKEIIQAINVGEEVLNALNSTIDSLDHAENWGTWDLLGGGLLSDLAKHSHIDDAKESAETTHSLLRKFKSELADIQIVDDIRIDIGDFGKFADFFFDGLIADWSMQSKIKNSLESTITVKDKVEKVMCRLDHMKGSELCKIKKINEEMVNLIISV